MKNSTSMPNLDYNQTRSIERLAPRGGLADPNNVNASSNSVCSHYTLEITYLCRYTHLQLQKNQSKTPM